MRSLRRNLVALVSLLVIFEGAVSAMRGLSLTRERAADLDLYHHDPAFDIVANYALAAASLACGIAMASLRQTWTLRLTTVVLAIACLEALWLVVADYGGVPYLTLLFVRGIVLIVLMLTEVRDQFR